MQPCRDALANLGELCLAELNTFGHRSARL
jgi:hypothetical protein